MLNQAAFINCVTGQLAEKGFGKDVSNRIVARYNALREGFAMAGHNSVESAQLAADRLLNQMRIEKREKAKRFLKTLAVQVDNKNRIELGGSIPVSAWVADGGKTKGAGYARAAVSAIEDDARIGALSYSGRKETVRGQLFAVMADVLEKTGKGVFGVQRGVAHLPNVVRELYGENTGDLIAKQFADAWTKTNNLAVDLFNQAGGSMRKLADYRLPQAQNAAKIVKAGFGAWHDVMDRSLDWSNMRWPDGSAIDPSQRFDVLRTVYDTITTNGANKVKPNAFRGQGSALGNALEQHRFLKFKSADAWLEVHEKFADGNVFDVIVGHIEDMSHKTAMVQTFGPNPEQGAANLKALVRQYAAKEGTKALAEAEAILKNKFDKMFEVVSRQNPMDPNSVLGAAVTGTANLLTAAQLGSAALLAIPGDFITAAAVRKFNGMKMFSGTDLYFKTLATDREFMKTIAAQSGFVVDEAVASMYAATRFNAFTSMGPAATRRVADAVIRASGLSAHTKAARWTVQAEFMGMMSRDVQKPLASLPWKDVAKRYGISDADWDFFRQNVAAWSPRKDVNFLRPIDILNTSAKNKQQLYEKFQGMIFEESRRAIPESTVEASVFLKDTTRPDTFAGALMYSFAMYKNFPASMHMIYGRLGLTNPNKQTRIAFYAGLGAALTLMGGLGTQMREVTKGRDPLPMDTFEFWGKAALSGGALGVWGDFLFQGVNDYGKGPQDVAAGPLVAFTGDSVNLLFGEALERLKGDLSDKALGETTVARAAEMAKRYTPGSSVWWARLALEREVWDRVQELADPKAYQKRQRQAAKRLRDTGQESWWAAGDRIPERAPSFERVVE